MSGALPLSKPRRAVFLRMASRPIPRVTRMMSVARELGAECLFAGANRNPDLPTRDEWEGTQVVRIGGYFPLLNGRRPLTYARGVFSYWISAVRLLVNERPALIHASDFETGVPAIIASTFTGAPVIYNIHDNLAARYALPKWVRSVLNVLEGILARAATVTLVPEPFRKDLLPSWAQSRVRVVRNSPDDPGFAPVNECPAPPPRVLFAGWLDFDRGLREVMELARVGAIRLVVAGEGDERVRELIASTPNTEYRGFCTHTEIMRLTVQCDYVAAFYNPVRDINRYAASNKIAEALAVGRPVLTNTELLVAERLTEAGAALAVPYAQIAGLAELVRAQLAMPGAYRIASDAARRLYESDYHSNQVRRASVDALIAAGFTQP